MYEFSGGKVTKNNNIFCILNVRFYVFLIDYNKTFNYSLVLSIQLQGIFTYFAAKSRVINRLFGAKITNYIGKIRNTCFILLR